MHEKVGGQTTLIDPALEKVGGQLTPLTPCFRGLWFWVLILFTAIGATSVCRCWLSVTVASRSTVAGYRDRVSGRVRVSTVASEYSFVDWLEFGTLIYTFTIK